MGASQQSVEWKLNHEEKYLKEIKEENQKKNTINISTPPYSIFSATNLNSSFSNLHPFFYKKLTKSSIGISKLSKKKSEIKKYNLNILYYDEHLRDSEENSDNCSFIEMNTNGTFYGCHNFELFKIVCEKLVKSQKEFILLSSGSCAQKIFDYCLNIKEIREYFIYCFLKDKYMPLMNKYPKLKGVYNIFSELKAKLYIIKEISLNNIASSNLIFFEDYNRIYIKLHYEFIRKYSLYKLLKSKNCNEQEFL